MLDLAKAHEVVSPEVLELRWRLNEANVLDSVALKTQQHCPGHARLLIVELQEEGVDRDLINRIQDESHRYVNGEIF